MRLFNFSIVGGRVTIADLTAAPANLITSGTSGIELDRASDKLYAFASHYGVGEGVYGNAKLYNVSTVNTSNELAMSQSFSAPMAGSALVDFVFITDRKSEG